VKYDDAKDPRGFLQADAVLVGVSRCSKTPVSMYLAHRRLKVANLPLVPEVPLPKEILTIPRDRIVGLRVDPMKLSQIRQERVRAMGLSRDRNYADLERILMELDYAETIFRRLGCPVVDVTNKAVEETAVRVLELIHRAVPEVKAPNP
jgi:regulator of PEP synthase PpsR (kinase-PPPase family)